MTPTTLPRVNVLSGRLLIYVAFDWGDEIDLTQAREQGEGIVVDTLRRRRTPISLTYRQPPLRFALDPTGLTLPGQSDLPITQAEATVFDFGGASVTLQVPFARGPAELLTLAASLTESAATVALMRTARGVIEPVHARLLPLISNPVWREDLWEEYFVFQFPPGAAVEPEALLTQQRDWLAGLLRLEDASLSEQEIAEALRYPLRYGRDDLFIPDWGAGALIDLEGASDETLQVIEFANVQLLELRHLDQRLDGVLKQADTILRQAARSWLPMVRAHTRPLRQLGELKVEASQLFERTGNALKLVGEQYLARAYRLLAARFHLPEWEADVRRKLEVLEGIYSVLANQAMHFRSQFLEIVIVLLIAVELLLALFVKR